MSDLDDSLQRVSDALSRRSPKQPSRGPGEFGTAMGIFAIALLVAGVKTGNKLLIALAVLFAAAGGAAFVARNAAGAVKSLIGEGGIGMGAVIEEGALVEPGATVEMGATVQSGARVLKGARVRMGATIERDAVLAPGAIVSWGATVQRGASIGEAAIVGAGATVQREAVVPPGMRINPGATFGGRNLGTPTNFRQVKAGESEIGGRPPIPVEQSRAGAVCDRLEQELREAPGHVRAFLGTSEETIKSLRRTCEDLARREQAMRDEASAAQLDEERAALSRKHAAETDPHLRASLDGALQAIDELKKQRELLRVGADRLAAEQSRLVYTLEGLASQFVRLRTAGPGAAPAELQQSLAQLRERIDAIADAIEEVSKEAPAAMRELAVPPPSGDEMPQPLDKKDAERHH